MATKKMVLVSEKAFSYNDEGYVVSDGLCPLKVFSSVKAAQDFALDRVRDYLKAEVQEHSSSFFSEYSTEYVSKESAQKLVHILSPHFSWIAASDVFDASDSRNKWAVLFSSGKYAGKLAKDLAKAAPNLTWKEADALCQCFIGESFVELSDIDVEL